MEATHPPFVVLTIYSRKTENKAIKERQRANREENKKRRTNSTIKMAVQASAGLRFSPLNSGHSSGLRQPSDRFALKSAFFSPSLQLLNPSKGGPPPSTSPKFSMRVASKQAYICRDCGYIYSDRTPFEKLPDNYFCPVCGAPKRRFRAYEPAVSKNANDKDIRKARKEQLKRDEAIGKALPVAIVLGVAGLAGLYFYLNSAF